MNGFGRKFRVNIFGESHGEMVGVTIDGCPPGIELCEEDFSADIARRKSGAEGTTPRKEADEPVIVSGLFNGRTTGSPMTILFRNTNTRSGDYKNLVEHPRPGHADLVAMQKYKGFSDFRGGGHFSGRITLGLVAAGVVAKKIVPGVKFSSEILELGGCAENSRFDEIVKEAVSAGDSIGGIVECRAEGCPAGLGEPFFDSVESQISHAVFSVPAIKAIEFGAGFGVAKMRGSENNDLIVSVRGETSSNNAGGINGGITNGNTIVFRVAVKPTPSISVPQKSVNLNTGETEEFAIKGRHDACIALRVPVILEAVTAIVLADLSLIS